MSRAPVSVVIPTYNSARYLGDAVQSVLAQTSPPAEIIVIDDGSKDDTAQRIAPFLDRTTYRFQNNAGVSAARNYGVSLARQPFVAFLDADDVWHPAKLQRQVDALRQRPDLVLLGTGFYDWPGSAIDTAPDEQSLVDVTWRQLVVKNRLVTSSVIASRDAILEAGCFDTRLQGPEDRDLWIRLAERGGVAKLAARLTGYRAVGGSVSRQAARCYDGMRRIMQKLDERGGWRGERLLRRQALSYIEHSCAWVFGAAGDHRTAARMVCKSLLMYPLPYDRDEVGTPFERPKRLVLNLLRAIGQARPEPELQPETAVAAR